MASEMGCRNTHVTRLWCIMEMMQHANKSHFPKFNLASLYTIIGSDNGLLPGRHQAII